VVPVRKSGRNKGTLANLLVMEKAQRLVVGKNLEIGNDFHILDSQSDDHLASVLLDSCVTFVPSVGTLCEALSLLRAKEKVQVALARVAAEKELADRAAREAAVASLPLSDSAGVPALTGGPPQGGPRELVTTSLGLGGDPGPSRAKPRHACAKRPVLTIRKGRGKKSAAK
jgi:hypothetical protein